MPILLLFAFISGIITIFAPCIWPLLPVILSSSSTGGKSKPLGITLGIMASFTIFTLSLSYIVKLIPFDSNILRLFAAVVIGFLGLTLAIPALNQIVEGFVSRISSHTNSGNSASGFRGGFITGFSLGIVWSPCAGPILATIATLSATQSVNIALILVTLAYVSGVGIPLFIFATIGNRIFTGTRKLNKYTGRIQQAFGTIMILTAVAIYTNVDKTLQANLLNYFPSYSNFINTFESNKLVKIQLDALKGINNQIEYGSTLGNYGPAPEFTGISKWLNTDKPVTMADLKGKVVLIDFWTYTCINCIRTLPHVTAWYDKYHDKGFVVIGVHTPEFEFEKKTENVQDAIERFNIHYLVAQDNEYATWNAYSNQYWPAEYLIDANGVIRHTHFGEGEYDVTEKAIQDLLKEAGNKVGTEVSTVSDNTPQYRISPETYVGSARMERFASNERVIGGKQQFSSQISIPLHYFAFNGIWDVQGEYAKASKNATMQFHFSASHVYLVMHPAKIGDKVRIYIDEKPVSPELSGKDVKDGVVTLDMERLYDLIDTKGKPQDHTLKLEFLNDGIKSFAFTFG